MAFRFAPAALIAALALGLLVACMGQRQQITPGLAGAGSERSEATPLVSGPLVYVAHVIGQESRATSVISIVSLKGSVVGEITGYGYTWGICLDGSGNLWALNYDRAHWYIDKFPRGATKASHEFLVSKQLSELDGCAVDPNSGDLAVLALTLDGGPVVLVWRGAHVGTPAQQYRAPFPLLDAAYDNAGNLFVTGWWGGSDWIFDMGELPKGGTKVTPVNLNKHTYQPGDVQWDGTYVVVSTRLERERYPRLYRVQVPPGPTGQRINGSVVQIVSLHGSSSADSGRMLFVLNSGSVIAPATYDGNHIWKWAYPAGGKAVGSVAKYDRINRIAISN